MIRVPPILALLFCLATGGFPPPAVFGQAPPDRPTSVRAFVTPGNTVGVGRPFVLNVEISGTRTVEQDPVLPDLASFARYLGSSSQSSVQMVNGRTSVSVTLQYRYQALTEGSYTIPSFEVEVEDEAFSTRPVEITISRNVTTADEASQAAIGSDELFITAEASKRSVYEGEPLVIEYRIWTRVDVTRFGMTTVPEPEGFWVEDVTPEGQPVVEQRMRDGRQYTTALIRRIALVPSGAGERTVEPIGVEAQVRVRAGRDPFEDFFGRSSLFGTRTVPTTVLANPVRIEVRPLPPGAPEPYSGMVGSLELSASVDRDSIAANEAVTLTVRATGTGNVRALPEPDLGLPEDFEVFPPEVSESVTADDGGLTGTKIFEYVLIPRAPGVRELPAIRYSYFDDAAGAYRMAASDPSALAVSESSDEEGPGTLGRRGVAELRRDIRYIRLGPLDLRRTGGSLFRSTGFWIFALAPLLALVGAFTFRRHRDRLEGDVAYARGRRAGRVARKRLARARALLDADDARAFHAEVARAVRGLVADRLNLPEAGLQTTELDRALEEAGIDHDLRRDVVECLEECDRQRFAPPSADRETRERLVRRAGEIMTALEQAVR
ncbi:MAG: BatD family protein [Longimicrobiales bacterium]|nr:BatD family protein [Longimicrobiales bacterium]